MAALSGAPAPSTAAPATPESQSLGRGGWSWFADPRAVYYAGRHRRTYVGWIDREGHVRVASRDEDSGVRATVVLRRGLGVDDHNNPSLHVLPDGRLAAFYSRHGGSAMHYRVSTRPEDIGHWGVPRRVPTNSPGRSGYTYPNPVQLSRENRRLFLFWRGGNWQLTFSTNPNLSGRWSPARTLIKYPGNRPYLKVASNLTDTIHFAFTQGHPWNLNTNIYYAAYRKGAIRRVDGTTIRPWGKLPIAPREADVAYYGTTKAFVHDVAFTSSGRPVIVYATFPSRRAHRYWYARWAGAVSGLAIR